MKKSVITKLCLLLALLMAVQVFAVSCNKPTPENPTEEPTTPAETPTEDPNPPEEDPAVPTDICVIKDGVFQYTVIVPDNADSGLINAVEHVNIMALSLTKTQLTTLTYSQRANATTEKLIYAGFTPAELPGVYMPDQIHFGTYSMGVLEDGNLYVSGYSVDGISVAITELTKTWRNAYDRTAQILNQTVNNPTVGISDSMFGAVPVPPNYSKEKNPITTFEVGDGITQMYIAGVNTLDAVNIFEKFSNSDVLTTHSTFALGKMTAGTYLVGQQYVYYVTHHSGALRINAQSYRNAFIPENVDQPNFDKVCNTKGYMVGITADEGGTQNGMCFVYLLADGTFLIYDGGRSSMDADHLYEFLKKLADENSLGEIVVSAIHLTHSHGDHTGYYETFLYKYVQNGKVTLNALWMDVSVPQGGNDNSAFVRMTKEYAPDTKIVQLQTGQSFYMADMKVEVIHTIADHEKDTCFAAGDTNAASTFTRLTVNDWSILMTGDAYCTCSDMVASIYGEDLHSTLLQVPHHGVWRSENGTPAFYDAVNPDYALIPCGEGLYSSASSKQEATIHLLNRVMKDRNEKGKYVFVAGHYTGNGKERITEINFKNHTVTIIVNKGQ